MWQLVLNFDVLMHVCESICDTKTVLSFSLVSHSLHSMAVKRLLSMKPVALKDERTIRAFHKFIFTDSQSRLPFLRALDISIRKVEEEALEEVERCILDLLEHATHLERLAIPYPGWTLFNWLPDPRLPDAIMRISTLRELSLLGFGDDESAMIVKSTRSATSLRVLRLSLDFLPTTWTPYGVQMVEVDAFLRHLIPTLEVLDTGEQPLVLDTKGAEYPALRSFVGLFEEGMTRVDLLVSKFPALDGTLGVGEISGALRVDEPEQRRIRASNQDRLKQRCWKHLDRVTGDVIALFVLGLTCPVRHLMVDDICGHERSQLVEILRTTPPTHLKLSSMLYHGDDILEDLFPAEVIPRLSHLVLVLEYTNPPTLDDHSDRDAVTNMKWRVLLTKIISSICALRLTHFRLFINYDIRLNNSRYVPHSKDFVRSLAHLDHTHLATELAHAVPSLQYVFVSVGGQFNILQSDRHPNGPQHTRGRWFTHSAWKNVPSGPPRRLDADVMEQILVDEDLVLSDGDTCSLGFQRTWKEEETAPWPLPE